MSRVVLGVALFTASLTALPSHGQAGGGPILPPTIRQTGEPPLIRMYMITALIGALVIGANMIPSKRGHQD